MLSYKHICNQINSDFRSMLAVLNSLYFFAVLFAVLSSVILMRSAYRSNIITSEKFAGDSKEKWVRLSFTFLCIYYTLNLATEVISWSYRYAGMYNNHIYAYGYLLHLPLLFIFFAIHIRNTIFNLLTLAIYSGFVFTFFWYQLWKPDAALPYIFGIYIFSTTAVAAIFFLSSSLIKHSRHPNVFKIQLGIVFLVYNFLAVFITVLSLRGTLQEMTFTTLFVSNLILTTLFYLFSALVMLKLYKSLADAD